MNATAIKVIGCGETWSKDGKACSASTHGYTATRFVVPFEPAFVNSDARSASGNGFRVADDNDWICENKCGREWYLTRETRQVLFERAGWYVWDDDRQFISSKEFSCGGDDHRLFQFDVVSLDGAKVSLGLRPPALVIFEKATGDLLPCGFLLLELVFLTKSNSAPRLDDVLLINELFRYRVCPYLKHQSQFGEVMSRFGASARDQGFDDLPYAGRWLSWIDQVMVGDLGTLKVSKKQLEVYADSRAFVWARIVLHEQVSKEIIPGTTSNGKWYPSTNMRTGVRDMFGYWIRFLNTDTPKLSPDDGPPTGFKLASETNSVESAFADAWAADHTYRRWEHYNCYYGFNDFCAAMLTCPIDEPPTWQHWSQMYFDQVILLLYIRVTLFRFSSRLTEISSEARGANQCKRPTKEKRKQKWRKDFRTLRWQFTLFENLYQFPLLSNQQQAIEMYSLARKKMSVDDFYEEISKEIQGSDALMDAEVDNERSTRAEYLNILVAGLGFAALVFGAIQTIYTAWPQPPQVWPSKTHAWLMVVAFLSCVVLSVVGLALWLLILKFLKWYQRLREKEDNRLK